MKNYLKYTLWFTLLVWAILLLMSYLPPLTIYGHTLKKIDIFSDIRTDPQDDEDEADSVFIAPPLIKPIFVDTCRTGLTCIEDYSDSTFRGMPPFYKMLNKINSLDRPVRIAVFGDSFIEADILTADLREMLQNKFGGCGVGYVDVTSVTYGFRPTVQHSFSGWRSHSRNDSIYFDSSRQGISGRYFVPYSNAYVELKGQSKYASRLDTCEQATIYFYNNGDLDLSVKVNKEPEKTYSFISSDKLQNMTIAGDIGSVRWKVINDSQSTFYGMALDGKKGIVVDNLSLRGSSGLSLSAIPGKMLRDFNELRQYDLIILQYGLNIATPRGFDYDFYKNGMMKSIEHLKECFPQAGFLLLSVGDRNYKTDAGVLRTMPGVKNLVVYQKNIAAESRIAFWNMFEAMGGDGSMANLVHAKPAQANYDYTHINFRGGKFLAGLLYETLIYGKEQYDRKEEYEDE